MASKRKQFWGNNPRFKQPKTASATYGNRFQDLSDLDEEDSISDGGQAKEPVLKVPPIVVDLVHSFTSIIRLFGAGCKYKRMTIGTKVLPKDLHVYEETIKKMKELDFKFYTHPVKDQQKFKLMLFGLPKLDVKYISEQFKTTFNIEPISIKEVITPRSTPDDALYMFEFDRNKISKKEVTQIRDVCKVIVRWRKPLRRVSGPTQCSKCAMFGHGSSNCNRKYACLGCGGPHDYSTCQLNKTTSDTPVVYKCFNCAGKKLKNINHRADDPRCPSRREYLEIREKLSRNRRQIQPNTRLDFSVSPDDFPSTLNRNEIIPNVIWPRNNTGNTNRTNTSQRAPEAHTNSNSDNDLSNEKILEIYFEALDALQKCKNKYDKMRVLGKMLSYVI